jgi:hypothetical protein
VRVGIAESGGEEREGGKEEREGKRHEKAEPVRARLGIGKEWRLVSVEFAI